MTYRVVVWGPGNVGRPAIRGVIRNPALELVGVIAHNADKNGVDAGELAGLEPVGVAVGTDSSAVLDLLPDALVYAVNSDFHPQQSIDECCEALRAGINVVAVGLYGLMHPSSADPTLAEAYKVAALNGANKFAHV